jgi:hypothetical protein
MYHRRLILTKAQVRFDKRGKDGDKFWSNGGSLSRFWLEWGCADVTDLAGERARMRDPTEPSFFTSPSLSAFLAYSGAFQQGLVDRAAKQNFAYPHPPCDISPCAPPQTRTSSRVREKTDRGPNTTGSMRLTSKFFDIWVLRGISR